MDSFCCFLRFLRGSALFFGERVAAAFGQAFHGGNGFWAWDAFSLDFAAQGSKNHDPNDVIPAESLGFGDPCSQAHQFIPFPFW